MTNNVNIAYYEKKDWEYFLSIIDDRESMHESWDDWFNAFSKLKAQLVADGFVVKEVPINITELIDYCRNRKIKNDGNARSQFVQTK
jgi:hypothetical protein